jgi:asparagine synthase (glutamine-hydrolysing)
MCGICGIYNFDERPADREVLGSMLGMIRHRGPDEYGLHLNEAVGLGHARLSIIDLSGGHQPMHNHDRSVCITFNGEIFNYLELREELERKGRRFATTSDTEVLLQLYETEGEDCVHRLNGQWAFAIWDQRQKKLFLSRDRMGVRPLFYCQIGQTFLFASEIKALFAHPSVPRELDFAGIRQVFALWHTVPPRTAFANISELPPGHSLVVRNGSIRSQRYWQLDLSEQNAESKRAFDERSAAEELGELLIDATRIRLRADVPVGAYLSGGLDSSVITALIRNFTQAPLETFSVTFDDPEYDESPFQQMMVSHLGTAHHQVRCTHEDIGRVFPDVVWHAEKPLLRTAPAPMYLLANLVRQSGFKVVLTGEGSDEVLGGYDIFKETKIRSFWAAQPESRLRPLLLRRLYPYMPQMQSQPAEYLRMFFRVRSEDLLNPFFSHLPRWETTGRLELLFSRDVALAWQQRRAWEELADQLPPAYQSWDSFRRAQYLESAYLLPGYILSSQGDRPAMAHAVEGRFPFLDRRVVEFAASLPPSVKMRGLDEKHLLKRFAEKLLPREVLRRPKQPYRAPEVRSFLDTSSGRLRHDYLEELLSPESLRASGIFHPDAVRSLVERLRKQPNAPTVRDGMALTGAVSMQLLYHQFIAHFRSENSVGHENELKRATIA